MSIFIDFTPLKQSSKFTGLWASGLVVGITAHMMQMAIAWTIYDRTQSSVAVGGIGLAIGIPTVIFGLIGGSLTDSYSPKLVALWGISGQILSTFGLFLVSLLLGFSLPGFYILLAALSGFRSLTAPTRRPYINYLLPKKSISAAMSLYMLSGNAGLIIGPIIGGIALQACGQTTIFALFFVVFS